MLFGKRFDLGGWSTNQKFHYVVSIVIRYVCTPRRRLKFFFSNLFGENFTSDKFACNKSNLIKLEFFSFKRKMENLSDSCIFFEYRIGR